MNTMQDFGYGHDLFASHGRMKFNKGFPTAFDKRIIGIDKVRRIHAMIKGDGIRRSKTQQSETGLVALSIGSVPELGHVVVGHGNLLLPKGGKLTNSFQSQFGFHAIVWIGWFETGKDFMVVVYVLLDLDSLSVDQ